MMSGLSTLDGIPRRLSKPRTKTLATHFSPDRDIDHSPFPMISNQQDYFGDYAAVVSSQGERRSRRKSRNRIRNYLYGSSDETPQTASDEDDGQSAFKGAARDVRKRISRTGSSIMQLQSARPSTIRLSDSSSSRLHLAESQSSDAEESAIVADQIKERAYQDSVVAQNHIVSLVDHDKHVDSVMAPVRRKSLYTPGLATRDPSDILRKPPQPLTVEPHVDRDYYYDPSKPKESPLSQLAALHIGEDGRSTPSSMNYPQLGGLQLGTLRVTNGTASPVPRSFAPSLAGRSSTPESKTFDDYYTASEGSFNDRNLRHVSLNSDQSPESECVQESLYLNDQGIMTPRRPDLSEDSGQAPTIAQEYRLELDESPFCQTGDEAIVIPQSVDPADGIWRQFINVAEARHGENNTRDDAFRKLNGDDIPPPEVLHPISTLKPPSGSLPRHDGLIDMPNTDSGYASNTSLDVHPPAVDTNSMEMEFPSKSSNADRERKDTDEPTSPKNLPDFRSRSTTRPRDIPQNLSERGRYSLQEVGPPPLPYSFSVMSRNALPAAESFSAHPSLPSVNPVRKLRKARPKSQPSSPIVTNQRSSELVASCIPRVPSIIATKHAERLRQFSLLDHTFPSSQHVNVEDPASPTEGSDGIFALPIRFPSPANALEAAIGHDPVEYYQQSERERSRSKSRKFFGSSRNGKNAHSRASPRHFANTETEVQDEQWSDSAIVRSPSWSEFGRGRTSKKHRRLAKQDSDNLKRLAKEEKEFKKRLEKDRKDYERRGQKGEEKHKHMRSRSASRTRAKSSDRANVDDAMVIADFGTVTESLGGSPYDIATSMLQRHSYSHSGRHPHQISTEAPRPKSIVGMDQAAAAEIARARSRARSQGRKSLDMPIDDFSGIHGCNRGSTRPQTMFIDVPPMPALAAIDLRGFDSNPTRDRWRSTGVGQISAPGRGNFNDRGGIPGRLIRAQSSCVDAPPVPALPSAQQVKQRENQITKARPKSMFVQATPGLSSSSASIVRADDKPAANPAEMEPLDIALRPGPHRTITSRKVPDLWTSGSLEKKSQKSVENPAITQADTSSNDDNSAAVEDDHWRAHRQAWQQRRKSAGEALLRNRITDMFEQRPQSSKPSPTQNVAPKSPPSARALTAGPTKTARSTLYDPDPLTAFPNPLTSHPCMTREGVSDTISPQSSMAHQSSNTSPQISEQKAFRPGPNPLPPPPPAIQQTQPAKPSPTRSSNYTIPRKRVGSGTTTPNSTTNDAMINRLTGRYDGGLLYGYEPGCGLGGSAGTRGAKTGASRKSVDVSRGFGLDLSDVPILIAPSKR